MFTTGSEGSAAWYGASPQCFSVTTGSSVRPDAVHLGRGGGRASRFQRAGADSGGNDADTNRREDSVDGLLHGTGQPPKGSRSEQVANCLTSPNGSASSLRQGNPQSFGQAANVGGVARIPRLLSLRFEQLTRLLELAAADQDNG